jgi:hypothetical protein
MKRILLFFIALTFCSMHAQNNPNIEKDIKLFYKPPTNINGFTLVTVNFSYEVVNVFGTIHINAAATCRNNLEFQYKGREYRFSGNEVPVRSVLVRDPVVKVIVTGPNNFRKELKLWILGLGASVLGDSSEIKDAKTPEEKDPANYHVEVIGVESVSYERLSPLISMIEEKLREEKKEIEIKQFIEKGDNALNRENFSEAENNYKAILRLDKDNNYAKGQLEKIKQNNEKVSSKKRYDDAIAAAEDEEAKENYENASKLYEKAASENINNNYAQNQANRVNNLKDRKIKEAQDKAKAIKEKIEQEDKINNEAYEKKEAEKKKILEERDRITKELLDARQDSIADSLDRQERKKLQEEAEIYKQEQDNLEKAKEEADKDELKKEALERRSEDNDQISAIEEIMSDDPVRYAKYLSEAKELMENSDAIEPYDELQLKKEWWDNNAYIQHFADDLYEPQIKNNHDNYMKKSFEAKQAYYTAKNGYMEAMRYVDKGSSQQKWLLSKIEYCNKRIDSYESNYKTDFNSEGLRVKQKQFMKSLAEGNRMSENRQKAESAYDMLNLTTGSQNNNTVKKYELAQRTEVAHQQYVQDLAIAGVSQSIVMNAITNNNLSVKDDGAPYMFNMHLSAEYNNVPILMNETSDVNTPTTTTGELNAVIANIALDSWYYRSKYVDVNLGLSAGYGVYPMEGTKTSFLHYSAKVNVDVGYKGLKLATLAQFLNRTGSKEIDQDITMANMPNTNPSATNNIGSGSFNYNILRAGLGLKIGTSPSYSNITLMVYAEKPDFYKEDVLDKPIYSYALEFNGSEIGVSLEYAPNYVIAGTKDYSLPNPKSKDYFGLKFYKTWSLF